MSKKIVSIMLILMISAITIFGCAPDDNKKPDGGNGNGGGDIDKEEYEYMSLLTDKTFKNGYMMRGLGEPIYNDPIETFGEKFDPNVKFQYEKQGLADPEWNLCQWATRYPFHDTTNSSLYLPNGKVNYSFEELSEGKYKYENTSKNLVIDTNTGEYSLGLKASECFKSPRVDKQEWPHWFIEKRIYNQKQPPKQCHIASSQSLKVNVDVKVNSFEDKMNGQADPNKHSALCVFYLFVANLDPKTQVFTDMLWFGITIFDNRYVVSSQQSFPDVGSKGSATEKWIFNMAGSEFFGLDYNLKTPENEVILNEWRTVEVDVLQWIQVAFDQAQSNEYMKSSKWENLYINGMYCGYETPGTYDIDMSFKNLDITSYVKTN